MTQSNSESVATRPLLDRNRGQDIHSIYPTEELKLMKKISLNDSKNVC